MGNIGAAAACSACSTLAEYEETNKATSAAPEQTDEAKQSRKFNWQKNSENLQRLANAERNEAAQIKDASQTGCQQSDSSD